MLRLIYFYFVKYIDINQFIIFFCKIPLQILFCFVCFVFFLFCKISLQILNCFCNKVTYHNSNLFIISDILLSFLTCVILYISTDFSNKNHIRCNHIMINIIFFSCHKYNHFDRKYQHINRKYKHICFSTHMGTIQVLIKI